VGQREHCKSRGLYFISMEKETKIIYWEWAVLYMTQ